MLNINVSHKKNNIKCSVYKPLKEKQNNKFVYNEYPDFVVYGEYVDSEKTNAFNLDVNIQLTQKTRKIKFVDRVDIDINDKIKTVDFDGLVFDKQEYTILKTTHFLKNGRKVTIVMVKY